MSFHLPSSSLNSPSSLHGMERWDVYHRLQELGILCECSLNNPLKVYLDSPEQVILFWGVVKQITATRLELIEWLQACWQKS